MSGTITFKGQKISVSVYGKNEDDIQILEAFNESGEELNDKELEEIQESCAMEIYEIWFEDLVHQAEIRAEMDR